MEGNAKNRTGLIIRLIGLILALRILSDLVDWRQVWDHIIQLPLTVVAICLILSIFRLWVSAFRWQLLNPDPNRELSSRVYFRYMLISATFNLFLPGALGGGFLAAGGHAGTAWRNADNLYLVQDGIWRTYFLQADGRWYDKSSRSPADVSLQPGMGAYYYHRGEGLVWTALAAD